MPISRMPNRTAILAAVITVAVLGCNSTEDRGAAWTAKEVNRLRIAANRCLKRFHENAGRPEVGASVEDLECYVEMQKRTTELFASPAECPSCFARYGEGLRMLGDYYRTLRLKQEQEARALAESARPADRERFAELTALAEKNEELAQRNYREALTQFNFHLRGPGPIDSRVYQKGFECATRLERYKVAIEYLQAWERNEQLSKEQKQYVDYWTKWAQDQYDKALRARVREELEG